MGTIELMRDLCSSRRSMLAGWAFTVIIQSGSELSKEKWSITQIFYYSSFNYARIIIYITTYYYYYTYLYVALYDGSSSAAYGVELTGFPFFNISLLLVYVLNSKANKEIFGRGHALLS